MSLISTFAANSIDTSSLPGPKGGSLSGLLQAGLTVAFSIVGAICLIIIVIAGFRYVVSRGEPAQIAQAKNAIIYALVGLVVCMFAVAIVNFVIGGLT